MLNTIDRFGAQTAAACLTLIFSAIMVIGAVGPAVTGNPAATTAAALDNTPDKPSQSLV
ncbi:hypothetical protein M2337_000396 [Sphingobium sp. B2D3A]|uniref:hypothetical protein n=1 Tax=Sphingobium TaxID=165695 RepID=UPI0015EBC7A2|nr:MULTISPECIES: hypothetical protein [Sphingobium]MCW2336163.1 hypothetical protein [Sphingobium sp. B2D3A]MCW2363726.1 hypothetical protein [Sphingobium sp. B10D3B]MCW2364948.1 hypothetical protein [Sphingobium sp. B7D2B]MCW2383549.1 hypothetical protein [Sphingobium sp. B2D3B]MCW2385918.1 hypothetical protein [Sphingobium sp. B2D3D]